MSAPIHTVFGKIKELSSRSAGKRPYIKFTQLETELDTTQQDLKPILTKLKKLRLVTYDKLRATSVKLTPKGDEYNQMPR